MTPGFEAVCAATLFVFGCGMTAVGAWVWTIAMRNAVTGRSHWMSTDEQAETVDAAKKAMAEIDNPPHSIDDEDERPADDELRDAIMYERDEQEFTTTRNENVEEESERIPPDAIYNPEEE